MVDREKLIASVRDYPLLYDSNDKDYTNMERKDGAWNEIAKKLETTSKDCKKTWTLIRDYHRAYIKKQKEMEIETETEVGNSSFKKWKYADDMSFLLPYIKNRQSVTAHIARETHSNIEETIGCETSFEFKDVHNAASYDISSIAPTSELYPCKRRRSSLCEPESIEETAAATLVKYILDDKKNTDEVDYFFNGVATTVKSFPPDFKIIAKAKVFELITKMELEVLNQHRKTSSSCCSCRQPVVKNEIVTDQNPS